MHSFFRTRTVLLAALCSLGLAVLAPPASAGLAPAKPKPGVPAKKHGFRLFARTLGALTVNRVLCGLNSDGEVCVDSTNSSTIGGGFWPKGTADQYVFNSGLQIAGIIGSDANPEWVGDTTGAFFFDPKGTTQHGEQVEPIYNTNNPDDLAFISDTLATDPVALAARVPNGDATAELYNPLLRGRAAASQGDVWWLSWDGNPSLSAGRPHPLGILVEQRGLGWNFPVGNEDILYFVYTFYNVTAADPAVYVAAGARPGMSDLLAAQGKIFQDKNEQAYGISIPDGGYTINNLFAAFSMDADVAEATVNFSSVNVPFALGYVYAHDFSPSAGWTFDPSIFSPPFFSGSGFVGVKYLKSPLVNGQEVGLTLFSNTINGGAFDDAQNTTQLYRYLSNNISAAAGDANCNTGDPKVTHICYVNNTAPDDMRFFQSSGPLTLGPGQFGSIVVAYIFAAPVITGSCTGPGTCDLAPGDPRRLQTASQLVVGANPVDSVSGYHGFRGADPSGAVVQDSIDVVPGSLLGKSLVAQAVFNNGFLLPFAPDTPDFFLIPSDNQVTIVWRPSASEVNGDPFFAIASTPTTPDGAPNPLFDPNYRRLDVEGYRVYRGRVDSPNQLSLVAQFDYAGTLITDFTGQVNPVPGCAPEIGIKTACPVPFDSLVPGVAPTVSIQYPLTGPIIQVRRGDRTALATGEALILHADTSTSGGGLGRPDLKDTGVPFTFIDHGVRSNLRYFYSVVAFDINSFQSGPASLESPRSTKPVTPVAPASNFQNSVTSVTTSMTGRGATLDSSAANPTIDATTGEFSGPFPPANAWSVGVGAIATQVLTGTTNVAARLDSIQLGSPYQGVAHKYWFTVSSGGSSGLATVPILQPEEVGTTAGEAGAPAVPIDPSLAARFGGNANFKLSASAGLTLPGPDYLALYGRGCVNNRDGFGTSGACAYNGSRWFAGPSPQNNETQADPIACNTGNFSGVPMTCYNNAGVAPGAVTIYQTQCYQAVGGASCRPVAGIQSGAKRAADFNLYWGTGGVIDSVIDATHHVAVPFDTMAAGSWGVLNQSATAVGPSLDASATLTNADFSCVEPFRTYQPGGFLCPATTAAYKLSNTVVPGPVGFFSGGAYPPAVPITPGANNGFALYISGDMFTFELTGGAAPAAGTVWSLRQYVGAITGGNGAGGALGPYVYSNPEGVRPLTAVGVELNTSITVTNNVAAATANDLTKVHTVPDPYYVTNQFEQTTDTKIIKFVNLPKDAIVRIYSSSGVLVTVLEHHSETFGGDETWNVRNRNNQVVASGVYFYHIEAGDARRVGRFTVVNFAQ